jgi:hypothetical protein
MIEEMDEELAKVIEDFMRAVDVEALRLAKKSGKQPLSRYSVNPLSVVSCRASRARASTQTAYTYQDWLSPAPPLYGWHSQISPQRNRRLGDQ